MHLHFDRQAVSLTERALPSLNLKISLFLKFPSNFRCFAESQHQARVLPMRCSVGSCARTSRSATALSPTKIMNAERRQSLARPYMLAVIALVATAAVITSLRLER